MSRKRLLRKELKQPDEFVSFTSQSLQFISEHRRLVSIVIAVILVLVAGRWVWNAHQVGYRERAASEFAQATASYSAALLGKNTVQLEKAETGLQNFLAAYSKNHLADLALLYLGQAQFNLGKYDSAIDSYTKLLRRAPAQPTIVALAHNGLGHVRRAKGEYLNAAEHFAQASQVRDSFLREQALINQARVLAAAGQTDKANQTYQQLVNQFPDSPLARLARQKLAGDIP